MGLDMYARSAPLNDNVTDKVQVDFDVCALGLQKYAKEFQYWRKHHDLHGWMHQLYNEKGGTDEDFNCVPVRLTHADLDRLEEDIKLNRLPKTTGFFFGNYPPDEDSKREDLDFIRQARSQLDDGRIVWYTSWW